MPRKGWKPLTDEQFKNKIHDIFGDKITVGKYSSSSIAIEAICNICDHKWYPLPIALLGGYGCKKCGKGSGKTAFTHNEFLEKVKIKSNNNIEVIGVYTTGNLPIKVRCLSCGYVWDVIAHYLTKTKPSGCHKCARVVIGTANRFTDEEFKARVWQALGDKVTVLDEYVGQKQKIKTKCNNCGNIWSPMAGSLVSGYGCRRCHFTGRTKTHEEFENDVKSKFGNDIIVVSKYTHSHNHIWLECLKCKRRWKILPSTLNSKTGCKKCNRKKRGEIIPTPQSELFKDKLFAKHRDNLTVVDECKKLKQKRRVICNSCNYQWQTTGTLLINGIGCPKCKASKGEKAVSWALDDLKINYQMEYVIDGLKNKGTLRFDFAVFSTIGQLACIIEYDGIQHFQNTKYYGGTDRFNRQRKNDEIKNRYCKDNNIILIRIPYTDFKKISPEYILDLFKQFHIDYHSQLYSSGFAA